MYSFCVSFLPVNLTFSALMTTTKSPVSTCGVKIGFCFPRNKLATLTATRPKGSLLASTMYHFRSISLAFAENVLMPINRKEREK